MLASFFSKVVDQLHKKHADALSNFCLVLPNRRAALFLKSSIAEKYKKTIWAPDIIATEDFVSKLSGLEIIDSTSLLFQFYEVYSSIEKEKKQSFEEFMKWGQILLTDYNEIDSYHVDSEKIFEFINENRAMEVWNVSGEELTEVQKNYLKFWKSIGLYYKELKTKVLSNKLAYPGLAYRMAAESTLRKLQEFEKKHKNWEKIIFIGFNALNECEEIIIKNIIQAGKGEIYWDYDNYYLNDPIQEAGKFLRKHRDKSYLFDAEKSADWMDDHLLSSKKKIQIIGAAGNISQSKLAGDLLEKIDPSGKYKNTALVLADENLLLPVINSLPEKSEAFNITMGYPLKNSPLFDLIESLLWLQENAKNFNSKGLNFQFYFKDLLHFISNKYSLKFGDDSYLFLSRLKEHLIAKNKVFISPSEIETFFHENNFPSYDAYHSLFSDWGNDVLQIIDKLKSILLSLANSDLKKSVGYEIEFIFNYIKILTQLSDYLEVHPVVNDFKTLRTIIKQLISVSNLSFYGEPLKGLQIMGMLETRNLDFENIILLSVNEGILPGGKTANSFIPFEIKKAFNLPTYAEKDAIFSYHFYRLIQRAKNVFLVYNTEVDEMGSGEKSRFISQLISELPAKNQGINISEAFYISGSNLHKRAEKIIVKKKSVVDKIKQHLEKGISPSALNTYIQCPLNYYYKYILGLKDENEVEEHIEAASFGTFVHEVLEEFYRPLEGKIVTDLAIQEMRKKIKTSTYHAFLKKFSKQELHFGKNNLTLNVAIKYVEKFLDSESKLIKQYASENKFITILKLEENLKAGGIIKIDGLELPWCFTGKSDRIDKIGDTIRIIDYKTGSVEQRQVTLESMEELKDSSKSKCFQLLSYAFMYQVGDSNNNSDSKLQSGIISLRKPSSGYFPLKFQDQTEINTGILEDFASNLKAIFIDMLDETIPFKHNEDAKYCEYCGN